MAVMQYDDKCNIMFMHPLQVPNHGLALAVAHEWASVKDKIQPSLMHLVSDKLKRGNAALLTNEEVVIGCNTEVDLFHKCTSDKPYKLSSAHHTQADGVLVLIPYVHRFMALI